MAIGFVLITTIPGEEESVRSALDNIEHVTDRWMLFGEFDILARVQACLLYTSPSPRDPE